MERQIKRKYASVKLVSRAQDGEGCLLVGYPTVPPSCLKHALDGGGFLRANGYNDDLLRARPRSSPQLVFAHLRHLLVELRVHRLAVLVEGRIAGNANNTVVQ